MPPEPTPLIDDRIRRALARPHLVEITTTGRRSGRDHRVELVFHAIDGKVIISGMPGRRDWYANLLANPRMTFHLKGPVKADLPATARPITEPEERRRVMEAVTRNWRASERIEIYMRRSPLIEVVFDDKAA